MAGRITRRSPARCSATIRPGSSTPSRRRSVPAPLRPTLADRSLTGRRCGWRASAVPTSMPTGKRRTTSSPTPTRSTRCSSESGPPTATVASPPCAASCTARWRSISPETSMCRRPASRARTASRTTICPPMRMRSAPLCSTLSTGATGRSRGTAGGAPSHARPFAAGADRHARARAAARRCRRSRLSDAGGGSPPVHRVGRQRRGPAHSHRGCPLSRGPFTDRTPATATSARLKRRPVAEVSAATRRRTLSHQHALPGPSQHDTLRSCHERRGGGDDHCDH